MPKRSSKNPPEDENVAAFDIVRRATESAEDPPPPKEKNPAAVALGKLGGKKGGPARARKLSAERRREIAVKAAHMRWSRTSEEEPDKNRR